MTALAVFQYPARVVFGAWLPIEAAQDAAPATPGVLQARGDAVIELPKGKSAMLLYAASDDGASLQSFVRGAGAAVLERARAQGARHVRFGPTPAPQAELARLLERFDERFGAPPPANRLLM